MAFYGLFWGGRAGAGEVRVTFLILPFLFNLPYFGVVCPEPQQCHMKSTRPPHWLHDSTALLSVCRHTSNSAPGQERMRPGLPPLQTSRSNAPRFCLLGSLHRQTLTDASRPTSPLRSPLPPIHLVFYLHHLHQQCLAWVHLRIW